MRGCDHWLTRELDLGKWGLLTHLPVPGMYCLPTIPSVGTTLSRAQSWENNLLLSPSGQYTWLNLVKTAMWTFTVYGHSRQASHVSSLPHETCYLPIRSACLFISSIIALIIQGTNLQTSVHRFFKCGSWYIHIWKD